VELLPYYYQGKHLGSYHTEKRFFVRRAILENLYMIPIEVYKDDYFDSYYSLIVTLKALPVVIFTSKDVLKSEGTVKNDWVYLEESKWEKPNVDIEKELIEHYLPQKTIQYFDTQRIITNMPEEMFNDALFYLENARTTSEQFAKWRYYRSSIVNFCASAEAWVQDIIVKSFRSKPTTGNSKIQKWLDFLTIPGSPLPGKLDVNNRFNNILSLALNIDLNNNTIYQKAFGYYFELTNIRNTLLHYSVASFDIIYKNGTIEGYAENAPNIIMDLIYTICEVSGSSKPVWLSLRHSRSFG